MDTNFDSYSIEALNFYVDVVFEDNMSNIVKIYCIFFIPDPLYLFKRKIYCNIFILYLPYHPYYTFFWCVPTHPHC